MTNLVKYPRTSHLPFSEGSTSDDKVLKSVEHFVGKEIVVTLKMDGENSTLLTNTMHARSLDSRHHPSRDWLKQFWGTFKDNIPQNWRICGENLYARHSIAYDNLPSYFMGFSIWDENNVCLDWDTTLEWFELIGIIPVETIYRGIFDLALLKEMAKRLDTKKNEGFVVRVADAFHYKDFGTNMAKFVRAGHVTSSDHWAHTKIIPNGLAKN